MNEMFLLKIMELRDCVMKLSQNSNPSTPEVFSLLYISDWLIIDIIELSESGLSSTLGTIDMFFSYFRCSM